MKIIGVIDFVIKTSFDDGLIDCQSYGENAIVIDYYTVAPLDEITDHLKGCFDACLVIEKQKISLAIAKINSGAVIERYFPDLQTDDLHKFLHYDPAADNANATDNKDSNSDIDDFQPIQEHINPVLSNQRSQSIVRLVLLNVTNRDEAMGSIQRDISKHFLDVPTTLRFIINGDHQNPIRFQYWERRLADLCFFETAIRKFASWRTDKDWHWPPEAYPLYLYFGFNPNKQTKRNIIWLYGSDNRFIQKLEYKSPGLQHKQDWIHETGFTIIARDVEGNIPLDDDREVNFHLELDEDVANNHSDNFFTWIDAYANLFLDYYYRKFEKNSADLIAAIRAVRPQVQQKQQDDVQDNLISGEFNIFYDDTHMPAFRRETENGVIRCKNLRFLKITMAESTLIQMDVPWKERIAPETTNSETIPVEINTSTGRPRRKRSIIGETDSKLASITDNPDTKNGKRDNDRSSDNDDEDDNNDNYNENDDDDDEEFQEDDNDDDDEPLDDDMSSEASVEIIETRARRPKRAKKSVGASKSKMGRRGNNRYEANLKESDYLLDNGKEEISHQLIEKNQEIERLFQKNKELETMLNSNKKNGVEDDWLVERLSTLTDQITELRSKETKFLIKIRELTTENNNLKSEASDGVAELKARLSQQEKELAAERNLNVVYKQKINTYERTIELKDEFIEELCG